MPEIEQMLKSRHRRYLHMCQTDTLNTQLPISAIQSLTLHNLTVLSQHIISDHIGAVLFSLELKELSFRHVVQRGQIC
jgi:hypothetical protein